jgi:hypothetical protein
MTILVLFLLYKSSSVYLLVALVSDPDRSVHLLLDSSDGLTPSPGWHLSLVQLVDLGRGSSARRQYERWTRSGRYSPLGLGNVEPHEDTGGNGDGSVDESGSETKSEEHGRGCVAVDPVSHVRSGRGIEALTK